MSISKPLYAKLLTFLLDLPVGHRTKLTDYLVEFGHEVKEEYAELDEEELLEYHNLVEERRKGKATAIRDKPKARQKDVDSFFDKLKYDVSCLVFCSFFN